MKKHVTALGFVALGSVLALAGERLLLHGASGDEEAVTRELAQREDFQRQQVALAEERCKKNAEFTLVQTFRLTEFRRFAQLGQDVGVVVVSSSGSSLGGGTRVPRVVMDPAARQDWSQLAEFLGGLQGGVDARVFEAFGAIRDFTAAHPWPPRGDLATISRSGWSGSAVVERWVALNRTLASRVSATLGGFYTG